MIFLARKIFPPARRKKISGYFLGALHGNKARSIEADAGETPSKTETEASRDARRTPNLPFPGENFAAGSANFPNGSGSFPSAIMPKFSGKQRLWAAVGVAVPLAIFFAARSATSWRPHLIGVQPIIFGSSEIRSESLILSPDDKWLVSCEDGQGAAFIWNLNTNLKHKLSGSRAKFSEDSRWVAMGSYTGHEDIPVTLMEVQLTDGSSLWKRELPLDAEFSSFAGGKEVQTWEEHSRCFYDANTGKLLRTLPLELPPWRTTNPPSIERGSGWMISYFPNGATKPRYSLKTTDYQDRWELSPDKSRLWVSLSHFNRFDVLDARTGKRLWFYASKSVNSGRFSCYPAWEEGGKKLATIENDVLVVRDSRTGKVLLSHPNNLPAPLTSWAFTKDGSAVYLMDTKGEIFRQRLR